MKKLTSFSLAILTLFIVLLLSGCRSTCGLQALAPAEGSQQSLHYPNQLKFIAMSQEERRTSFQDSEFRSAVKAEGCEPKPVTLSWKDSCGKCKGPYSVTLSYNKDFAEGTCVTYTTHDTQVDVTNLRIATTYYWKVQCDKCVSQTNSFVTDDVAPRLLRIPDAKNCRDLGGRIGKDGRRVRQDMVIRTGGLNYNSEPFYYLKDVTEKLPEYRDLALDLERQGKPLYEVPIKEIPYLLHGEWTAFLPNQERFSQEMLAQAAALKEIPAEFYGAKGFKKSANEDFAVKFDDVKVAKPALLMMEFEAPEDGVMPFRCGGDWYWMLCLNGNILYDHMTGNIRHSTVNDFTLYLPVKKGKNLVTVTLGSGLVTFAWYIAPVVDGTKLEDVIAKGRLENQAIFSYRNRKAKPENCAPGYVPGDSMLDAEGLNFLNNTLKLKTEIDLRRDDEVACMTGSPAGDTVQWHHYSSQAYDGLQDEDGRQAFAKVFQLFLDEKNYPINFHCIAGQDRTGAVAFIINALLGVDENQLYLDWECTIFRNGDARFNHERLFDKLVKGFQKYPGNTIQEKVENYVLSLGFTKSDIQTLRDIMLE